MSACWTRRTFYACPCGFQDDTETENVPVPTLTLDCRDCKEPGTMRQCMPPSVAIAIRAAA
jgi:hypothetical protein